MQKGRTKSRCWQQFQLEIHGYVQSPEVHNVSSIKKHRLYMSYCNYCGTILLLEFSKSAAIYYTSYHISHVEGLTNVSADYTMQLRSWV